MDLYNILKIVFSVLICLPMLVLGVILFSRLSDCILNIDRRRKSRRQAVLDEQERRRRFDIEYSRRHGDTRR